MPAVLSRWTVRDPATVRDWALAALQFCRVQRGRDTVLASRYWISKASEIAILTEFEPGANPSPGGDTPDGAKAIADLLMLAENTSNETWSDARSAADMMTRAGA
jgi:hypothetical protein